MLKPLGVLREHLVPEAVYNHPASLRGKKRKIGKPYLLVAHVFNPCKNAERDEEGQSATSRDLGAEAEAEKTENRAAGGHGLDFQVAIMVQPP